MKLLTNIRFAVLVIVFLVWWGGQAAVEMPKELYPDLEIPIAMTIAIYPGAPPELVEVRVTNVIERAYKTLPRLTKLKSASIENAAIILTEFDVDADFDDSFSRIKEALEDAKEDLPSEVEKIMLERAATTNAPVITANLITDIEPRELMVVAEKIQDRLEAIEGVSEVRVAGVRDDQVQVLLNRHRMDQIGASLNDVVFSLQAAQQEAPLGRIQTDARNYPLQLERIGLDMDALRMLPVRSSSTGESVPLADIATVKRGLSEPKTFARFVQLGDHPRVADTVIFDVLRQPGGNLIDISNAVQAAVVELGRALPPDAQLMVTMDQAREIKDSVRLLVSNGISAVILVFFVLFFFLGVKESIVAGLSIPLTFLATFIILDLLGYSINSLSLMALVIALGLLVDDFILVMEGMHDGIHKGLKPFAAAEYTLKTYGLPSISGTLTTIAAFAPMALLGGINGKFIRVVPVTVAVTLTMSYLVSMSVDLAVGAAWFKKSEANWLTRATDKLLKRLSEVYYQRWSLACYGSSSRRWLTIILPTILLGLGVYVHQFTDQIIYPDIDSVTVGATLYLPAGATLKETQKLAEKVENMLQKQGKYVMRYTVTAGTMSSLAFTSPEAFLEPFEGEHILGLSIELKPEEDRDLKSYEWAKLLRKELAKLHAGPFKIHEKRMSPMGGAPIEVIVTGPNPQRVEALAETIRLMLKEMPELTGVRDTRKEHAGGFRVTLNDQALKHHNLSRTEVLMFLRSAIEGKTAATVLDGDKEIDIVVAYDWRDDKVWNSPASLEELLAMKVSGLFSFAPVPLAAIGGLELNTSPFGITHLERQFAISVEAENRSGSPVDLGNEIQTKLENSIDLEPGERLTVSGDKARNEEIQGEVKGALFIALGLIFAILVLQFSSFVQPLIIMLALPMAMIGVFFGFAAFDLPFSFPALVGVVSLAGIVVNDSIVLIDTINRYRGQGMNAVEACREGGRDRLRPILSTTLTTIIGLLPLAFTDPVWQGLCLTIVFGISLATILTLAILPALYVLILGPGTTGPAPSADGSSPPSQASPDSDDGETVLLTQPVGSG